MSNELLIQQLKILLEKEILNKKWNDVIEETIERLGDNETLKIYNYDDVLFDTGFPLSRIEELNVSIVSGDEIVTVIDIDGNVHKYDAAILAEDERLQHHNDGGYIVEKDKIRKWTHRKDSYDWSLKHEYL